MSVLNALRGQCDQNRSASKPNHQIVWTYATARHVPSSYASTLRAVHLELQHFEPVVATVLRLSAFQDSQTEPEAAMV